MTDEPCMATVSDAEHCVFCAIVRDDSRGQVLARLHDCIVIEPLNPVVAGHRLVIPTRHVHDAADVLGVTEATMRVAGLIARQVGDCNIITSVGEAATQTVFHLHVHVVPRTDGDGLALPWTNDPEGT